MTQTPIDINDAMPCPTCAALVLKDDIDEHQKWHATTQSNESTTSSQGSQSTGERVD
jgi:hypothetical protein